MSLDMNFIAAYHLFAFLAVLILAVVHFLAGKTKFFKITHEGWFLSMGGSFAISYVFIILLPKLAKNDAFVHEAIKGFFPYFEKHVYVMALLGFLFFLLVGKSHKLLQGKAGSYLSVASYIFLNFLIGYAIVDINNPEVKPLLLFTIAMGLQFFSNDFSLSVTYGKSYHYWKWLLIGALFFGFLLGIFYSLSLIAIALVSAFIGGGILVNVMRHELTQDQNSNAYAFVFFAIVYTVLLLFVGR